MAMRALHDVQKSFHSMGFDSKSKPFNHQILSIAAIVSPAVCFLWVYLIYETDSAQKYTESIYFVIAFTGVCLSFANTILFKAKIFVLIESLHKFWNQSQLNWQSNHKKPETSNINSILENTNELIEKCSRIGLIVFGYILGPCMISPKVFVSFFVYFTSDLGNNAFDLPLPMW